MKGGSGCVDALSLQRLSLGSNDSAGLRKHRFDKSLQLCRGHESSLLRNIRINLVAYRRFGRTGTRKVSSPGGLTIIFDFVTIARTRRKGSVQIGLLAVDLFFEHH